MATVNYRDPTDQLWKPLDPPVGPAGAAGTTGPTGPTAVSTDPGNAATINPDGIFVAPVTTAETDLLFVEAAGDTMTGALLLPDQATTPPPVNPVAAAAKGYVDQLITVSLVDPDPVADAPARDALIWNVIGEPDLEPPGYDQAISTYGTALYDETV